MTSKEYAEKIVREWCERNSGCNENLFVKNLRKEAIPEAHIAAVLGEIDEICHHCWNNPASRCHCWDDS